jgi:hypothetical protein
MSVVDLFNPRDTAFHALMLAKHMPTGKLWEAVFDGDKNLGKLVKGLAVEYYRLSVLIKEVETEMDITKTNKLIAEWEKSVGIPDDCFSNNETLARRQLQSREKLSNFGGVQKKQDFERVAEVFGFNVKVTPGSFPGAFPLLFPIPFIGSSKEVHHTILVQFVGGTIADDSFPLTFPIVFGSGGQSFLQCIFDVLAPANVQVLFID